MLEQWRKHKDSCRLLLIVVVLFTLFSTTTATFARLSNLMVVLQKCVELGLLSIGMTVCIITGGINLSSATLCSLNTVVIAVLTVNCGLPIGISVLVALMVSMACGLLNGYLVAYLKVAPMLATLGTQSMFAGIGLVLTNGGAISGLPIGYTMIGNAKLWGVFPVQVFILVAAALVVGFVTARTRLGRKLFLVGTSSTVAIFSGIRSARSIVLAYIISAAMSFLAAVVISSRLASGRPDVADAFLMQSIAAAILGGASVTGGKGSVGNCILSVLVFCILSNGLVQLLTVNAVFIENIILGLLLIVLLTGNMLNLRIFTGLSAASKVDVQA
ncbi:MAG: ABC transporter permease [Clostridiales bacterium]|jgi:ribose/xylose/arabinose/galactoside ABC-type transport system permease subunit|nr:ABC transporter permease [Clostridiales bacterium]